MNFQVFILDADSDGLQQISNTLAQYSGVDGVHIVSHGADGEVKLGNVWLNSSNLSEYADQIAGWRTSFDVEADLLIYGCNLAFFDNGNLLINALAGLTGADVAASDDLTGAASLGADWDLEVTTGPIETSIPFSAQAQENWVHVLVPPVVDLNAGTGGVDHAFTFTVAEAATVIVDATVNVADVDDTTLVNVTLDTGGIVDGADEELTIGDLTFALNAADFNNTSVTIGGNAHTVNWVNATGIATITLNSGEMTLGPVRGRVAGNQVSAHRCQHPHYRQPHH